MAHALTKISHDLSLAAQKMKLTWKKKLFSSAMYVDMPPFRWYFQSISDHCPISSCISKSLFWMHSLLGLEIVRYMLNVKSILSKNQTWAWMRSKSSVFSVCSHFALAANWDSIILLSSSQFLSHVWPWRLKWCVSNKKCPREASWFYTLFALTPENVGGQIVKAPYLYNFHY